MQLENISKTKSKLRDEMCKYVNGKVAYEVYEVSVYPISVRGNAAQKLENKTISSIFMIKSLNFFCIMRNVQEYLVLTSFLT